MNETHSRWKPIGTMEELSDVCLKISTWMGEEFSTKWYTSLDAMAKAEARLGAQKNLRERYVGKMGEILLREGSAAYNWFMVTAPAHIRAEALCEVLNEMG